MFVVFARPTRAARSPVGTLADLTARGKLIKTSGISFAFESSPGGDSTYKWVVSGSEITILHLVAHMDGVGY